MAWIQDIFDPEERSWEDFYRNRWAYDKIVRTTHGVNCTGGCSWNVYVKQGIVTWELQALDYPRISPEIPSYEPRGCQRGISYSWYVYSPLRVKYPYVRGVLLDLWRQAREEHPDDPVAAWRSLVTDPEARRSWQQARGKGGLRRTSWDEVLDLLAAANLHTVEEHGSDRLVGFSPIPAMSMISYASGARFLQLMGGLCLSFYDWYCDLPPASPEIWGEQTDVGESADWYQSKFIAVVGSNVLGTRTPDAHFLVEARHQGAKVVVFSPDFSQTSKVADEWIPLHQGQDGAFWMAVSHVLLKEFYVERQVPAFQDYLRMYTDAPFLVELDAVELDAVELDAVDGDAAEGEAAEGGAATTYKAGKMLRASSVEATREEENAEWKLFVQDAESGELKVPKGTVGHRWQEQKGQWNLEPVDAVSGEPYEPALTLDAHAEAVLPVAFPDFSEGSNDETEVRGVPARRVETADGPKWVTTSFELLLAQYGVRREPEGASADDSALERPPGERWPEDYRDEHRPFTPAWQERFTGVSASVAERFARQWGTTAEKTGGRVMIIIGAGVNHWYHNNLIYRAAITSLILVGAVGKNGGGWNHYVGQEKLVPAASWAPIAFGTDWGGPPRLQNTPSFHYMHSSQWRYDRAFQEVCPVAEADHPVARGHTADKQALAVRNGWLPCFPQFNRKNADVLADAREAGAETPEEVGEFVAGELKDGRLKFAMEDPDDPACWPRVWYIWRGNAIQASAKGHEYFLKHYLGTHHSSIAEEEGEGQVEEVAWHDKLDVEANGGKMDLVVDLNFRMDTSALYSDVVLPAATWYEKDDLNSTDLHSFLHPLQKAVPPCWESKSDWQIFKEVAKRTSELAADRFPEPVEDLVLTPLLHDTPAEIAQPEVKDWAKGECEPVPGKTMPNVSVVSRDYKNLYRRFVSLGPNFRDKGLAVHGTGYAVDDAYDEYVKHHPVERWEGGVYPSLAEDRDACEVILHFAAETNGEMAWRAFQSEAEKTGRDLSHLAADTRGVHYRFDDLVHEPRRVLTSPFWTGITRGGRTYSAFCQNVEELIPWRTLTGRQHLYLDHEAYRAYGEHLPTFKPRPDARSLRDLVHTGEGHRSLVLNYLTPHGKWHIHSTFGDNLRMETLSRGIEPVWVNDRDAGLLGIRDNDWVEVLNDHGVVVTRAVVSARIPRGMCFIYHATERTVGNPKSRERTSRINGQGGQGKGEPRRAGAHNSLTRARLKPLFMIGGYAQFTYFFNYWGPPGVNRDTYVAVRKADKPLW